MVATSAKACPRRESAEQPWPGAEEIQGPDGLIAQAHGDGLSGLEAKLFKTRGESRPCGAHRRQVLAADRPSSPEAVQARALAVLCRVQLDQSGLLTGGGHRVRASTLVGQHDSNGIDVEKFHDSIGQGMQEVDHVELGHQGVG